MNVITGLPRSGSTLLCNLLNQHPHIYASSTSMLPAFVMGIIHTYSTSIEIKSDLITDRKAAEDREARCLKAFIDAWYADVHKEMIFDKSRGWPSNLPALWKLYPNAKVIVTVRDPRGVLGSIEKQNSKNPLLDPNKEKSITKRVEDFFGEEGMVGMPIRGVEDIIRRRWPVFFFKYEEFIDRPLVTLERLHMYLEIDNFEHDLDNIENTATDVDALYLYKYPHEGHGRLSAPPLDEWKEHVPDEVARALIGRFPLYCQHFKYE